MTATEAMRLLEKFRAGGISRDKVLQAFQAAPVADLGFAQVDTHRALRKGFPEIIFGAGKTPEQVLKIASRLLDQEQRILVTLDKDFGELAIVRGLPHAGIIRLVNIAARQQAAVCQQILAQHGAELQAGAIVTAEPGRLRIRPPGGLE